MRTNYSRSTPLPQVGSPTATIACIAAAAIEEAKDEEEKIKDEERQSRAPFRVPPPFDPRLCRHRKRALLLRRWAPPRRRLRLPNLPAPTRIARRGGAPAARPAKCL